MPSFLLPLLLLSGPVQAVVDATNTAVVSTSQTVAMGGTEVAFAHGASGLFASPAAAVVRDVSVQGPFTWSGTLSWFIVDDEEPLPIPISWSGGMLNVGGAASYGPVGLGLGVTTSRYSSGDRQVQSASGHLSLSASTGPVAAGIGLRGLDLQVDRPDQQTRFRGAAPEAGVLFAPSGRAFSGGLVFRLPVTARSPQTDETARLAWQTSLGVGWASAAVSESARSWRVATDLVIDGPVQDGITEGAFVHEQPVPSGETVTFSPRLGVEYEALPRRLRLRAGTYLEADRADSPWRGLVHGTAGTELRLTHLRTLWGLIDHDITWKTALDLSARQAHVAWLGVGTWRTGVVRPTPQSDPVSVSSAKQE